MKKILKYIATVSLLAILLFCQESDAQAITQDKISNFKVRIDYTTTSVGIRAYNYYSIYVNGTSLSYAIKDGEEFNIVKNGNSVSIKNYSGQLLGTGTTIEFKKKDNQLRYLEIKNIDGLAYSKYPDNLILKRSSDLNYIYCINSTNIETYIKGVLPYEMGSSAPLEALKAQSVAARAYAVTHVGKYSYEGFDVKNDTYDQVYKGYSSTYFSTTNNIYKAVEGTKGIVLKYGSSLVNGLFSSSNGGYTADASIVWGNAYPYYKFNKDIYDTYIHPSTSSWAKINYTTVFTKSQLANQLRTKGYNISNNFNLKTSSSMYGYVVENILNDDIGHSYSVKNEKNRTVFGLKSQRYNIAKSGGLYIKNSSGVSEKDSVYIKNASGTITAKNRSGLYVKSASSTVIPTETKFTFSGYGYGHGVGMSQNGAMNRAEAGQTYNQILLFYYSGCSTATNYGN